MLLNFQFALLLLCSLQLYVLKADGVNCHVALHGRAGNAAQPVT
jgi:hypothetical protein